MLLDQFLYEQVFDQNTNLIRTSLFVMHTIVQLYCIPRRKSNIKVNVFQVKLPQRNSMGTGQS